jgi:hypothetical protein
MSRNLGLEKVGRAKVAYLLQKKGWLVGEAFADGYDLLVVNPKSKKVCKVELKTMDLENRVANNTNLTAPVSQFERTNCTHIIVYVEPFGDIFIARKNKILTKTGIFCAYNHTKQEYRKAAKNSRSFGPYKNAWHELDH